MVSNESIKVGYSGREMRSIIYNWPETYHIGAQLYCNSISAAVEEVIAYSGERIYYP